MLRFRSNIAPVLALAFFAFGIQAYGQSLFEGLSAAEQAEKQTEEEEALRGPLTAEQKAAGMRESIF